MGYILIFRTMAFVTVSGRVFVQLLSEVSNIKHMFFDAFHNFKYFIDLTEIGSRAVV